MSLAPNVENYTLGKGVVYFDRKDADGNSTGELDLGNAPAFTISRDGESLDHFSSREGIRKKDHSVDISVGFKLRFTLDEYSMDNLDIALQGDGVETVSQGAGTEDESLTARLDRWVPLTYHNVATGTVDITHGATHFTLGTDFTVDYVTGRIFFYSTGTITEGEAVNAHYDYGATEYDTVNPGERTPVEGFLRFVGDPDVGPKHHLEVWRAKISLVGDLSMITNDWGTIEFEGEILEDEENHADYPFFKVTDITENGVTVS